MSPKYTDQLTGVGNIETLLRAKLSSLPNHSIRKKINTRTKIIAPDSGRSGIINKEGENMPEIYSNA
jgi:hypothetical protein